MKLKTRNKSKIFLLILLALFSSGFIFSIPNIIDNPIDHNQNSNVEEKKEEVYNDNTPNTSLPNWSTTDKYITAGSQVGSFDPNNIKSNDSLIDDTQFSPGYDNYIAKNHANYGVRSYTGAFGTTSGGLWTWNDAYKYNDENYLYLESTWGNDYGPAWIHMIWGDYPNIPAGSHQHLRQIRIPYEVWADSFAGVLDASIYLSVVAYDDQDHQVSHIVAAVPGHQVHYYGTFTLTSGTVFDRVKAGGYIRRLGVTMYVNEEIWTFTWINVDYMYIIYDFNMPDLDFYYELDFGGLGLSSVSQFNLVMDINETIGNPLTWLYNYANSSWVQCGPGISSTGLYNILITSHADEYFSVSDELRIRFSKYDYYDGREYTQYHLKIDFVIIEIPPPDPPPNVYVDQEIEHIMLNWDPSPTYGAPVTEYNIYRGTIEGGFKSLIGTSTTNEYNDSAVTVDLRYYYVISASSVSGESANSSEVSGQAYDHPMVEWLTPEHDANIIFPVEVPITFHFTYDWVELDDVELFIESMTGPWSYNYGSVWNKTSIEIQYPDYYIDGYVNATLIGKNQSIVVATHSRLFTFVKITFEQTQVLNSSTSIVGKQLYLILHDPHGDNSYSSFTEETTISLGVGSEISMTQGFSFELGYFYEEEYSGMEFGASTALEMETTTEFGFDFRYEVSDATSLTSMQITDDPDYIGPGYGDRYWGESWIYKWVVNATRRSYSNGTNNRWEDPQLFYGIIRGAETYCSDAVAPPNWRSQNAVYNESIPVEWIRWFMESGGAPYTYDHAVTSTQTRSVSITISLGTAFNTAFGIGSSTVTMGLSMKAYVEAGLSQTHRVAYEINDDDPTDFIVQGIGIDKRFGTFIFNTSSFFCETSGPYEHGTYDYLPPEIDFPDINFDSDDDGYGPTPDDSPLVTVDIFEEGSMDRAIIWYSIDNGTTWEYISLTEYPNDPGTWYGTLPAQPYDTYVIWFIEAWDNQGNNATRYNSFGTPFDYTVEKKPSGGGAIPGFPLISTITILFCAMLGLVIIFYKKHLIKF